MVLPRQSAPEVLAGNHPQKSSDWWSYGAIIFEMIFGCTPFYSQSKAEMQRLKTSTKELSFPANINCSSDLKDLLRGLLNPDPIKRLGWQRGATEIKKHRWFKSSVVNWDDYNDVGCRSQEETTAQSILEEAEKDKMDEYLGRTCSFSS